MMTAPDDNDKDKAEEPAADGPPLQVAHPVQASEVAPDAQESGRPATTESPAAPTMSPAACASELAQRFPALFAADGIPRPLKLRIQADIQQRAPGVFTRKALSLFLHRHTTSTAYLKALVALAQRFDLDGAPAGEVAPEHLQAAKEEIERRRAIVAARRPPRDAARGPSSEGAAAPRASQEAGRRPARVPGRPSNLLEGRPPSRDRAPRSHRPAAADTAPRPQRPPSPPVRSAPTLRPAQERVQETSADRPGVMASDPSRRDRAALLRLWEGTALTKANFCVLKRISEAELDATLALARQERVEGGLPG
jgi:sRNA-binding protein